ncbi:hydroxymethylglutaryl-CoA lyase [Litchfieldia alkalitelluris]|uniref:hydroxymethylglutaryl-CoA lyase n=1 Tax=Litchfieldia alkalitelluris TaxID=304268 RepID=UPI000998E649|nr:hydroxymethylglutaryl-CoA lyase [Litchfieldia alkalitelluris]
MNWPSNITIKEVGPRDGLQNERTLISTEDKIKWINLLSASGLKHIEITSFVNPKWIPALADSIQVAKGINRVEGVSYSALVPNQYGLSHALESNIDEVAVFMSATEAHNKNNINKSIDQTIPILSELVKDATSAGKKTRGYLSTVFGCPYEGKVAIDQVIRLSESLFDMGIDELSLGDTIGKANPRQVEVLLSTLLKHFPADKLALHFHDTRGTALANILISLDMGITTFDSSVGGLGGCPYAPGASGNVATDDLIYMLDSMGIHTGINQKKLLDAAKYIQKKLGKSLNSHSLKVYYSG